MRVCLNVEIGYEKSECEDTALCNKSIINNQIECMDDTVLQCIGVADGVGGNAGGRVASRYVAHCLSQRDFTHMSEREIRLFVNDINAELINHAATISGKADMATTLTCVVATNEGHYLIHAGNTRLYIMQGAYLKQLTTDHTTYNWLMECGQYEAAEQCNRSEINCCLGGGNLRYANRLIVDKVFDEYPNALVLTSDGVHEFVDLEFIENALSNSGSDYEASKRIIDEAHRNGSKDDKTIIIVRR